MAQRIKPVKDYEAEAGVVTKILPPTGASRAVRVQFECRHCHLLDETRWTKFRRNEVKSCGCLSEKAFEEFHVAKAAELEAQTQLLVFEHVERFGAKSAGPAFKISKYVASYVWKHQVEELTRHPNAHEIATTALSCGHYEDLARKYRISVFAVRRLALIEKRKLAALADPSLDPDVDRVLSEYERQTPERQELWSRLMCLKKVYEGKRRGTGEGIWDDRPRAGGFSYSEFHRGTDAWSLYHKVKKLDLAKLSAYLREMARRFLIACESTRDSQREWRTKRYFERVSKAGYERELREECTSRKGSTMPFEPEDVLDLPVVDLPANPQ